MAPKSPKKEAPEINWRKVIENAVLNEPTWNMKVIFFEAAGGEEDRQYLNKFESFALNEKRYVIKCIGKSETIFMINQLGVEKKVRDDNLRVFEVGQAFLKEKQDIPTEILSLIIKHLILKMKEEYIFIKRQKLEVKEGLRQESLTMLGRDDVRGDVHVKAPEPKAPEPKISAKSKGKSAISDASALPPQPVEGKKYNTVLRERGEEWRDRVYVDDYPVNGPNVYIAISGFDDPHLPISLMQLGIPLTAVVQIRINPTKSASPPVSSRVRSETGIKAEKSQKFWEDLQDIRISRDTADYFKDTAFMIFNPPYWEADTVPTSPENIYDELCYLMYDVQDLSRQHSNYIENMELKHIPEDEKDDRYYRYYFKKNDDLPLECVTIYSLLDSILRTACKENIDENSSISLVSTTTPRQRKKTVAEVDNVQKARNLVRNVFNGLCKTDAERKRYRITYGDQYEEYKDPIMIQYGDHVKYTTFHLNNINLDNIVGSVLFGMPLHKLWLLQKPLSEIDEVKISYHVNLLLSCFDREDVETAELCRLLHILACRKLYNNRSSLKKSFQKSVTLNEFQKVYLKRSKLVEPLQSNTHLRDSCSTKTPSITKVQSENSYEVPAEEDNKSEVISINSLFFCPDITELVSAAEIDNSQPINHMIDEFEFFEDFTGTCSYQIMLDAFNKFNCVDYKYCEVTDTIVCMFFNSHDKDGIFSEEWRVHICTPVCLQDFFDFVLEEQYEWVQNEERKYDETLFQRKQSLAQETINPFGEVSCIEDKNVETDLLMEGSLKQHEMIKQEEANKQELQETSEKGAPSTMGGKSSLWNSSTVSDLKSNRKWSRQSTFVDPLEEEAIKPFVGYDIGDNRRVEVFGKDVIYFSKDRSRISCFYTLLIPYNIEYLTLNVVPMDGNNKFWVHKAMHDFISPEILEKCDAFRVDTKDQMMMNFKKQLYYVPLPLSTPELATKPKLPSKTDLKSPKSGKDKKGKIEQEPSKSPKSGKAKKGKIEQVPLEQEVPQFETKCYYSFCITWPNGLITESVHDENSEVTHIKQFYVEPLPHIDEDMRCISLNGEVVIFKTSGDIEVLCPDGRYIIITKYGKEANSPEPEPEAPPKFELNISEFEITESNGLKEKWIDDESYIIEKLIITTANDYCLGEVFSKRADGTHTLFNKDGVQIVTFPNGTRILTFYIVEEEEIFPEWTDDEQEYFNMIDLYDSKSKETSQHTFLSTSTTSSTSKNAFDEASTTKERTDGYISLQIMFTVEHKNFTTVTINKATGNITIESPNETSLTIDKFNKYNLNLDSATTAIFDGEDLNITYEACTECKSYAKCDISINTRISNKTERLEHFHQRWAKMKDSFCKKVVVNYEGDISLLDEVCSETLLVSEDENVHHDETLENHDDAKADWKSENSLTSHGKCNDMYQAKNVRFIVMDRSLNCSELVHRALVEQYKKECVWKPWCYIKQALTFGDHRSLHSILMPINVTETEKWLMNPKMCDKPANLTFKDLKEDGGKGFYHWMRPYEPFRTKATKVEPALTHKQPRAFVLRTLEHQWGKEGQEQLRGAKELLSAILIYRRSLERESETMLNVPVVDQRMDCQRKADRAVQALGAKMYENLKKQLEEDMQSRMKMAITTEPPQPPPEEPFVDQELEEEASKKFDDDHVLEEEATAAEQQARSEENREKYWRRRAAELEEEKFYMNLLREDSVPPYFQNLLGGAFWWELHHLTDEAITKAQRSKMKCVCARDKGPSPGSSSEPYM
ncbi:hypothetical protein NE865_14153 [Phthorimaea operculella]|nr:hypothetical protein NE865_14153 [Phthorimaea operculella]